MSGKSRTLYLGGLVCSLLVFSAVQSAFGQPRVGRGLQFTDPKRYYEELLEKDSRNAGAHYHLGLEHLREPQNTEKAVEHLERAVELDGENAEYHYRLGEAYIADFTYASIFRKPFIAAKVKAQLEQAVQYDPGSIQYREALIEYYVCAPSILGGSFSKASQQAEFIAAVDPYLGTLARARISAEEGEPKNAVMLYKKAIRMHPQGWQAYQRFGIYYLNRRQVDEAIAMFKKYVEVAPINADSYLNLGRAYERKRMYDEAIASFQMAFERDQSLTHLVFRIAQLYEFKGSKREAVLFYQKYLGLVSAGRAADDARTKIRDLSL